MGHISNMEFILMGKAPKGKRGGINKVKGCLYKIPSLVCETERKIFPRLCGHAGTCQHLLAAHIQVLNKESDK